MLNFLFPNEEDIDEDDSDISQMEITESCVGSKITVTTLSGESAVIVYQPGTRISTIKDEVEEKFKIPPNKQRLLYQDKELKVLHLYGESINTRDSGILNLEPYTIILQKIFGTYCHLT